MYELPRIRLLSLLQLKPIAKHQTSQIFAQFIINNLNSLTHLAKLIDHYSSTTSTTHHALSIFTHFHYPNLFLFNNLIRCSKPQDSIYIFSNWVSRNNLVPDNSTYLYVLGSCARAPSSQTLWLGRQVQIQVLKLGVMCNILVSTTLIHFYSNNRDVGSARKVFDEMPKRNVVTWNAMITGYTSQREKAKDCAFDGLMLFRDMLVGVCGEKPNDTTMVCVLSAISQSGMLETGLCIHGYIEKTCCMPENDVFIGTGLVDMYSKCGCVENAYNIFIQMKNKNVLTWTAMATGLAIHGKGKESLELLDVMMASSVKPNVVTFTSLFSACCHSGLVEEGVYLFKNMRGRYGVEPQIQHYGCVIDLLGRAGHLEEAYELIRGLPVKADARLWRSLLSACQVHGDFLLGEKIAKILLGLEPENKSMRMDFVGAGEDYVALSNVYSLAQRWEDVEMVRKQMKVKRVETIPGSSLVQAICS